MSGLGIARRWGQTMLAEDYDEFSGAVSSPSQFSRACPTKACRDAHCEPLKDADIEMLACIAARLAGQDPDRRTTIKIGGVIAFDDVAWRYHDFLARAEAAYRMLGAVSLPAEEPCLTTTHSLSVVRP
jgi:hypothetical protein